MLRRVFRWLRRLPRLRGRPRMLSPDPRVFADGPITRLPLDVTVVEGRVILFVDRNLALGLPLPLARTLGARLIRAARRAEEAREEARWDRLLADARCNGK